MIQVGQFNANLDKNLNNTHAQRNFLIITQNGKPAGVLISPKEFDKLRETQLFIDSISSGLSDSEQRNVLTTAQLKKQLKKYRAAKEL